MEILNVDNPVHVIIIA